MSRCIEIAQNGLGTAAPNPMVGCVIVHEEKIIGEGFTSPYGGPHAEVNAINSVTNKKLLKEATLYVTLEPCSHFGKTPPCADLIIENKIPKIVMGLNDPHEKVAGKGVQKLQDAGTKVITGVMDAECREHHKRFLTFHEKKRSYTILKWAETADGFIAPENAERSENTEPFWITNSYSRQLVHKWRSEEQAILVGTNTVLEDNPQLNVRHWNGKSPLRIVIDRNLKTKGDLHILDGSNPTLILTEIDDASRYIKDVKYEILDFSGNLAKQIGEKLYEYNCISVLIEGGAQTLQTFIDADIWDEARIFTGNSSFGKGTKAPTLSGKMVASKKIGSDSLKMYRYD